MNWLHYLLEANLYLSIFYLAYCLFLNKETYYTLNRVYLLLTCVISFALPLIQIGVLKPAEPEVANIVLLPPANFTVNTTPVQSIAPVQHFTLQDGLVYIYLLGVAIMSLVLLFKVYQLLKLTRIKNTTDAKYKLVYLNDSNTAFSFFNYLFIGTKANGAETIIKHELVHIRQKHSADIIFIELLKIVNWFNPFIYLLQRSLKAIHEYIADEKTAAAGTDAITYSSFLVNNAYGLNGSSITHSFFNYNLLKKRIIMLHQKRSGSLARLKYLLALPVCAGMLCTSTLAFSKSYGLIDLLPQKADTIRIAPPPPTKPPTRHFKAAPPTAHVKPTYTKKGYRYEEDGYLVKGKTDFRVIIVDKDGTQKAYFKSKATAAELKLLSEKYGYTFPVMEIYTKMPPPPPISAPGDHRSEMRPPPKQKVTNIKLLPPSVPEIKLLPPSAKPTVTEIKLLPPTTDQTIAKQPAYSTFSISIDPGVSKIPDSQLPFVNLTNYLLSRLNTHNQGKINVGKVEAMFTIHSDHKVSNVKIKNGLNADCDKAVLDALTSYNDNLTYAPPGDYLLTSQFYDRPNGNVSVKIDLVQLDK